MVKCTRNRICISNYSCMKKQMYLCVDLKVRTQGKGLVENEGRKGMLTMTENGEMFEFDEAASESSSRNIKVYKGKRLNVAKRKDGRYVVNFRHLELDGTTDPCTIGDEVFLDLERAKVELGL